MTTQPKFTRSQSNPDATCVQVGDLYLVAHKSGDWSVNHMRGSVLRGSTGKVIGMSCKGTWHLAECAVVNEARRIVSKWSSELDALAEELR